MKPEASFLLAFLFLLSIKAHAQEPWKLAKDKDGIRIFTRHVEGSNFKAYRAEATMEGSISSFVAVIRDIDRYPEWISNVEYVELIDSTAVEIRYYLQSDVPSFLVRDRDLINVLSFQYHAEDSTVRIDARSEPELMPENEDFVRIKRSIGFWEFHKLGQDSVRVHFQQHTDPEGSIPSWITNMFIIDAPFSDFQNLRERVKMKEYANARSPFPG
jgi:hypothetical protein